MAFDNGLYQLLLSVRQSFKLNDFVLYFDCVDHMSRACAAVTT